MKFFGLESRMHSVNEQIFGLEIRCYSLNEQTLDQNLRSQKSMTRQAIFD